MLPFFFEKSFSADGDYVARQREFLKQLYFRGNKEVQAANAEILSLTRRTYQAIKSEFDDIVKICAESAGQVDAKKKQWVMKVRQVESELLQILYDGHVLPFQHDGTPPDTARFRYVYTGQFLALSDRQSEQFKSIFNLKRKKSNDVAQKFSRIREILTLFEESLESLTRKRDLLAEVADYDFGFFEEMHVDAVEAAEKYWSKKRDAWICRVRQTNAHLTQRFCSLPIERNLEQEFFDIVQSEAFSSPTLPGYHDAAARIEKICRAPRTSGTEIPLGLVSFQYRHDSFSGNFTIPYCAHRDNAYFLLRAPENSDEDIKQVFEAFVYHIIRNTEAGHVDVHVADPEFKGVFLSKFRKKISESTKDTLPMTIHDAGNSDAFERLLREIQEHLNKTTSSLDDEETVAQYNEHQSGLTINHKVILINNFPLYFTSQGDFRINDPIAKICDIARNAQKCGITLLCCGTQELWEQFTRQQRLGLDQIECLNVPPFPPGFIAEKIRFGNPHFHITENIPLPIPADSIERLMDFLAASMKNRNDDIEFMEVLKSENTMPFRMHADEEIQAPFGKNSHGKLSRWFCSDSGEGQTILVGGTGSGKSNLLHAIITSACYLYSPEELQLYLIDLKQGVGFKRYADHRLPHARLIAIEGNADIAIGVLRSVWNDFVKRTTQFRNASVYELTSYRKKLRADKNSDGLLQVPRIIIVIDEFQILFTEDDKIKFEAEDLLNKIISQGRAGGFHVILATQNLTSVKKQIVDNVTTRIAMSCEENALNGLLSSSAETLEKFRKMKLVGEGVLLSTRKETCHFRAAKVNDSSQAECLTEIAKTSKENGWSKVPLIYNGATFADPTAETFQTSLEQSTKEKNPRLFLGESRNLTSGIYVRFARKEGENMLVVGNHESGELPTVADALYWTLAQSCVKHMQSGHSFSVYDEDDLLVRHFDSTFPRENLCVVKETEDLGSIIFATYHKLKDLQTLLAKDREGVKNLKERHFLVLLQAEQLKRLFTWKDVRESETPPMDVQPAEAPKGKRDYGLLMDSSSRIGKYSQQSETAMNARESLKYILDEGGKFGFHVIIATHALTATMKNLDVHQNELHHFFPHVVCLPMSADDSQKSIGSVKANQLGEKNGLYWNTIGSEPDKFRPYFPVE